MNMDMKERHATHDDDYAALVRGLLDDLAGTAITRVELRRGDLRIAMRRRPGLVAPAPHPGALPAVQEATRPAHWYAVEAPLTGIFYTRPAPDKDDFVAPGSHVEAHDVVGLIETMKMFNEVTADVAGTVREMVMEYGSLVQAGQPLLYIEPDDGAESRVGAGD